MVIVARRFNVEAKRRKACHMWLDCARAEVAATGKWKLKIFILVKERAEEHDNRASTLGSFNIHIFKLKTARRNDLKVIRVIDPANLYANTLKYLDDTIYFFNPSDAVQRCFTFVKKCGTEKANGRILACFYFDATR
ncbi:hypothetical protein D3C86_1682840 [compost metagenome]